MNRTRRLFRKELPATLAACLLAASFTAALLFFWHCRQQLALLDGFCTALIARAPETADAVYTLAKAGNFASVQPGVLSGLGYEAGDFAGGKAVVWRGGLAKLFTGRRAVAGRLGLAAPAAAQPAAAPDYTAGSRPCRRPPAPLGGGVNRRGSPGLPGG